MTQFALTGEHRRRLHLVARHGAERMSRAMSLWLDEGIQLSARTLAVVHFSDIPQQLAEPDAVVAAVVLPLGRDVAGVGVFLFDESSAFEIVRRVLRRSEPQPEWDELGHSALAETGEIACTAFLNGLALALNLEIQPEAPLLLVDYAQAVLDPLMIEMAKNGEYALLFGADVQSESGRIRGRFALLPQSASLDRLLGSI